MRRNILLPLLATVVLAGAVSLPALAQGPGKGPLGPPGGTIYAHDIAYRTIGTPALLPDAGQFNTIYVLGGGLANVSNAAPGDPDWRGGRWEVRPIEWLTIPEQQFTNAEQVETAAQMGQVRIGDVIKRFECPLIPKVER